jgi:hypothetical protein
MTTSRWASSSRRFEISLCLHFLGQEFFGLHDPEVGTAIFRNVGGTTHPTTKRYIPEGLRLQQHCCENFKSRQVLCVFFAVGIEILILG